MADTGSPTPAAASSLSIGTKPDLFRAHFTKRPFLKLVISGSFTAAIVFSLLLLFSDNYKEWFTPKKVNNIQAEHPPSPKPTFTCSFPAIFEAKNHAIPPKNLSNSRAAPICPDYFKWIYQDLEPWRKTGITEQDISAAAQKGFFRFTIVQGNLYSFMSTGCFQTRFMFTLWSMSLLVERFPGLIPDLDMIFSCDDVPRISRAEHVNSNSPKPPLFSYCTKRDTIDIPFPDWSFWGWPEVNIDSWNKEGNEIYTKSDRLKWKNRDPVAQYKGNLDVGSWAREQLKTCRSEAGHEYAKIYGQDWGAARAHNFEGSSLSDQCDYRYKIYAEGRGWSVSLKYIMACGSPVLLIDSDYYAFFRRGLLPFVHYLPIERQSICKSIEGAVKWGNDHPNEVDAIGEHGLNFLKHDLSFENIYAYMFHLLKEYASLLRFKPQVPPGALLVKPHTILCMVDPFQREILSHTLEDNIRAPEPCYMPPLDQELLDKTIAWEQTAKSNATRIFLH